MELGRDWEIFSALLVQELSGLGATEEETEIILDRAWHNAVEVERVGDYARGALELVRGGVFPFDRTAETPPGANAAHHRREREPDQG